MPKVGKLKLQANGTALRTLAANLFKVMTDEKKMMQLIENNVKMLTNAI